MGDPAQEPLSTGGKKLPESLLAQEAGQASVLFQNTHLSLLFVVVFCWFVYGMAQSLGEVGPALP